jgi:hypothetical protein
MAPAQILPPAAKFRTAAVAANRPMAKDDTDATDLLASAD